MQGHFPLRHGAALYLDTPGGWLQRWALPSADLQQPEGLARDPRALPSGKPHDDDTPCVRRDLCGATLRT